MYASQDWYHVMHTPDGVHAHKLDVPDGLDQDEQATLVGELAAADRTAVGFPEDYVRQELWSSAIAPGLPHPTIVGTLDDACPPCAKLKRT